MESPADPRPRTTACEECGFWPVVIGTDGSWYCESCEHQYHMSDDDLWWVRYTESADSAREGSDQAAAARQHSAGNVPLDQQRGASQET